MMTTGDPETGDEPAPLIAPTRDSTAKTKEEAATARRSLANNVDDQAAITGAVGLAPLVNLATAMQEEKAAGAPSNLATDDDIKVATAKTGGIKPLLELSLDASDTLKKCGNGAVQNLDVVSGNHVAIATAGGVSLGSIALSNAGVYTQAAPGAHGNFKVRTDGADSIEAIDEASRMTPFVARDGSGQASESAAEGLDTNREDIAMAVAMPPASTAPSVAQPSTPLCNPSLQAVAMEVAMPPPSLVAPRPTLLRRPSSDPVMDAKLAMLVSRLAAYGCLEISGVSDLELLRELGRGTFGVATLCRPHSRQEHLVLKKIQLLTDMSPNSRLQLVSEVSLGYAGGGGCLAIKHAAHSGNKLTACPLPAG